MQKSKFLLIILAYLFIFAACSDKPDSKNMESETQESPKNDLGESEKTTEPEFEIPAKDMGGKEFTVITSGWWDWPPLEVHDLCPEEYLGEPLNDAAYQRRLKIEENYNCAINQVSGSYEPNDDVAKIQKSVRAGDHVYDIAMVRGINFTTLLTGNNLVDLNELENIDFDRPWWRKKCSDALLLGGKRHGVSGNISTTEVSLASLMCFNKNIIKDHGFASPYELVENGDWTFDKLIEMAKQIAGDLDGDGKMTEADMWGINYDRDYVWNLLNAFGVNVIKLDSGGFPSITLDEGENLYKIQNTFAQLFDESYSSNWRRIEAAFTSNRTLFRFAWALHVVDLRGEEVDFGIIPLPKYNKEQKEYLPNIYGLGLNIICVPTTNEDMENTGLFLDVLSYEGHKSVVPVFYENILKTKSARDDESSDMIDYIFGNLNYDTGTLLNFNNFTQLICQMAEDLNTNIASFVEKNKPKCEAEIQKIMDAIDSEK